MQTNPNFINARTCTIATSNGQNNGLLENQSYLIPVYQRPIAWGVDQIQRLLDSIWHACNNKEDYFIGTLLLIPRDEEKFEWEVVDGQQRLTTILLLTHVAKWQYGESILPEALRNTSWLRTQVSSQQQQLWLKEVLAITTSPARIQETSNNPYLRNAVFLQAWLQEKELQGSDDSAAFNSAEFFNYLAYNVHAVAIETFVGLAKSLDIFNTINTTGLPLNGDDLFKIQLYDYLTRIQDDKSDEAKQYALECIDEFYAGIIARNKKEGYNVTSAGEILSIYQHILIERAEANRTMHELSAASFFERVFSVLLLNRPNHRFDKGKMASALGNDPLADLKRLVELRFVWENEFPSRHEIWHKLQNHTRYWRYDFIDIIYLYRFYDSDFDQNKFFLWKELIAKFYIIKTLEAAKIVNEARTFTYQSIRLILKNSSTAEDVVGQVRRKLHEYPHKDWLNTNILQGDVFENRARRDLTSRLSALLAQEPNWRTGWHDKNLHTLILGSVEYEVEHIHPRNPSADFKNNTQLETWPEHQNTLGNLVLLEKDINRRVLNYPLSKKRDSYKGSQLAEALLLLTPNEEHELAIDSHSFWSLAQCQERTKQKASLLFDFLFNESQYSA
jgi:hypothetical protein